MSQQTLSDQIKSVQSLAKKLSSVFTSGKESIRGIRDSVKQIKPLIDGMKGKNGPALRQNVVETEHMDNFLKDVQQARNEIVELRNNFDSMQTDAENALQAAEEFTKAMLDRRIKRPRIETNDVNALSGQLYKTNFSQMSEFIVNHV